MKGELLRQKLFLTSGCKHVILMAEAGHFNMWVCGSGHALGPSLKRPLDEMQFFWELAFFFNQKLPLLITSDDRLLQQHIQKLHSLIWKHGKKIVLKLRKVFVVAAQLPHSCLCYFQIGPRWPHCIKPSMLMRLHLESECGTRAVGSWEN